MRRVGSRTSRRLAILFAAVAVAGSLFVVHPAGAQRSELFLVVLAGSKFQDPKEMRTACGGSSNISQLRSMGTMQSARLLVVPLPELYPALQRGVCDAAVLADGSDSNKTAQIQRLLDPRASFRVIPLPR
jgi:hypothetical protein